MFNSICCASLTKYVIAEANFIFLHFVIFLLSKQIKNDENSVQLNDSNYWGHTTDVEWKQGYNLMSKKLIFSFSHCRFTILILVSSGNQANCGANGENWIQGKDK